MIQLTNDQLQAAANSPLRIQDSVTKREYVLVRAEIFDRAQALFADAEADEFVRDMYPYMAEVFGKAGWDDPAMDVYNNHQPPPQS